MNLEQAKAKVFSAQDAIAELLPAEYVDSTRVAETSKVLFECPGGYYWPGSIFFELTDAADSADLLALINDAWEKKSTWVVVQEKTPSGNDRLDLTDEDGTRMLVVQREDQNVLEVLSFSPCFEFDGEPEYGVEY